MLAVFQRMTKTVLAALGEDSFLRSSEPCRVNIEHGVQTTGPDGLVVVEQSIATIDADMQPRVGDMLVHPDGHYRLDVETTNNGHSKRFIVLPLDA